MRFVDGGGKALVEAVTTWALLDRATGRLLRVRDEIAARRSSRVEGKQRDAARASMWQEGAMSDVYRHINSPVGRLTLVASGCHLVAISWQNEGAPPPSTLCRKVRRTRCSMRPSASSAPISPGERRDFDLPLDFRGTNFQRRVWQALLAIPFGETRSYGEIAGQLGDPGAPRAVGAANGKNPIPIVAPCHRVIGADGSLTGLRRGNREQGVPARSGARAKVAVIV